VPNVNLEALGIPHITFDLCEESRRQVVDAVKTPTTTARTIRDRHSARADQQLFRQERHVPCDCLFSATQRSK
jgi:hypothetical protein